jgi:hypothetical protein
MASTGVWKYLIRALVPGQVKMEILLAEKKSSFWQGELKIDMILLLRSVIKKIKEVVYLVHQSVTYSQPIMVISYLKYEI